MKTYIIQVLLVLNLYFHDAFGQDEFSGDGPDLTAERFVEFKDDTTITHTPGGWLDIGNSHCRVNGYYPNRLTILNNGRIQFDYIYTSFWPISFWVIRSSFPTLTPYWALVERNYFSSGESKLHFKTYTKSNQGQRNVFAMANEYATSLFGRTLDLTWCLTITWINVAIRNAQFLDFDKRNNFQVLLCTDRSSTFVVYIYGNMDWCVQATGDDKSLFQDARKPVIGYDIKSHFDIHYLSGSIEADGIEDRIGNINEKRGFFGYVLENNPVPLPSALCINWSEGAQRLSCSFACPPTLGHALFFDPFFRMRDWTVNSFSSICLVPSFAFPGTGTVRCCYRLRFSFFIWRFFRFGRFGRFWQFLSPLIRGRSRLSGSVLQYHPLLFPVQHEVEEEAFENCVVKSRLRNFYFQNLPNCNLRWFGPRWAFTFGDPHYITLDNKNYTFNGCGWYTYVKVNLPKNNNTLVIQVRTTKVGNSSATAITAVALKEGNTETVQVNLKSSGGLYILVNGNEINNLTHSGNTTVTANNIVLTKSDSLEVATPLGNSVKITETANGTILTVVASLSQSYMNRTEGLLGKWNGDVNDDFTLPDGTILPSDMSESDIFYKFGQQWNVSENEKLYIDTSDAVNFTCPVDFKPLFFNDSLVDQEARDICGNDINCLYDITATGNHDLGRETLDQEDTFDNDVAQKDNSIPIFSENITTINITLGKVFNLTLTGVDDDGDTLTFLIDDGPPSFQERTDGNTFYFSWFVNSTEEFNITFIVSDAKNATSSFTPNVNLCACKNNGTCFHEDELNSESGDFIIMDCKCPVGKSGRYCENQTDFCNDGGLQCHPLVQCYNHPTRYTCGACPSGYYGNGTDCADIDECATNSSGCDQVCKNSEASFECSCRSGYRLEVDKKSCDDVDECAEVNDCAQLCNNTNGSYECYCEIGFVVNPDDTKNCKGAQECSPEQNSQCAQVCYMDPLNPGQAKCTCNSGYQLGGDGKSCQDVDECVSSDKNLCGHICNNTIGAYTCSCYEGFRKNGEHACVDINECVTGDSNCTGIGEICRNIAGGYLCTCDEGINLIKVNGICTYKSNDNIREDSPIDVTASTEQKANAILLRIRNFAKLNWTITPDRNFREAVIRFVNSFCNENQLRTKDCGALQGQIDFDFENVQRVEGYPINNGSDILLQLYLNYPNDTVKTSDSPVVVKSTFASIIFGQLEALRNDTKLDIVLETAITPGTPRDPTNDERNNSVTMEVKDLIVLKKWTVFYDSVFTRALVATLNNYCNKDEHTLEECGIPSGSQAAFNESHFNRVPGFPRQNGENAEISFYVENFINSGPMRQKVLASILIAQHQYFEAVLNEQLSVSTSAVPDSPPTPTSEQTNNSVTVKIPSFQSSQWTYLVDQRFRKAVADRLNFVCNNIRELCQIPSTGEFNLTDVQRTTNSTTQESSNLNVNFYANYPGGNNPVIQIILASVVKEQLDAIQLLSGISFTLETSYGPYAPTSVPTSEQTNNSVEIEFKNVQAGQWTELQDRRLRSAIAKELLRFCNETSLSLEICQVTREATLFPTTDVVRISSSPSQSGVNATYSFFVNDPSGGKSFPGNLVADILKGKLAEINAATGLEISVKTSPLAASPAASPSSKTDEAVTVVVANKQANEWSALEVNTYLASVATAITYYCNLNSSRRSLCGITNQTTFKASDIQRIENSPSQNGSSSLLSVYASFPNGTVVPKEILHLVLISQLNSIKSTTGLQLTVDYTPDSPQPTTTTTTTPYPTPQLTTTTTLESPAQPTTTTTPDLSTQPTTTPYQPPQPTTTATPYPTPQPTTTATPYQSPQPTTTATPYQPPQPTTTATPYQPPQPTTTSTPDPQPTTTTTPYPSSQPTTTATPYPTSQPTTTTTPYPTSQPTTTTAQNESAVATSLTNFNSTQWSSQDAISFQQNLTAAIIKYCNQSEEHLQRCNMSRDDLTKLTFTSVQIVPGYPKQNGANAAMLFYVNLPNNGVLPFSVLANIFSENKDSILSQPTTLNAELFQAEPLPSDTSAIIELKVQPPISGSYAFYADDIKQSISDWLNEYCVAKSSEVPCNTGKFTQNDIHVTSLRNDTVKLYVSKPGQSDSISADVLKAVFSELFKANRKSNILGFEFSLVAQYETDETLDWPLILGLCVAGALFILFIILAIVLGVTNNLNPIKPERRRMNAYSVYSSEGSWQFNKDSPYVGPSPFASIDTIPGFDEDGLPTEIMRNGIQDDYL